MKRVTILLIVFLIAVPVLPIIGSAQNRGHNITTPEAVGDETGTYSKVGNGVSVTHRSGIKKIRVNESEREIEIFIYADGRIKVDITRQFASDELDRLIRRVPELEKYVRSFPKEVDGNSVRLSIGLTSSVEGQNAMELRDKDLAAFNLYKRFSESSQALYGPNTGTQRGGATSTRMIGPAIPGIEDAPEPSDASDSNSEEKEKNKNKGQSGTGIG